MNTPSWHDAVGVNVAVTTSTGQLTAALSSNVVYDPVEKSLGVIDDLYLQVIVEPCGTSTVKVSVASAATCLLVSFSIQSPSLILYSTKKYAFLVAPAFCIVNVEVAGPSLVPLTLCKQEPMALEAVGLMYGHSTASPSFAEITGASAIAAKLPPSYLA